MPLDGQQVYGAQHPPSIKLIKELQSTTSTMSTTSSTAQGTSSSFKDYQKNTNDVWDIDDELDLHDDELNSFPISLADSEEMAKKVIKKHQEKLSASQQQPQHANKVIASQAAAKNGPGKALRQSTTTTTTGSKQLASSNLTENSSNAAQSSKLNPVNSSQSLISVSNTNNNSSNISSNTSTGAFTGSESNKFENMSQYKPYTSSYVVSRDTEEDESKLEKFRKIINMNPVNLEELQKACWKGIPKSYRPICWKLLSDYLPLKHELQEKTIEQKRNAYWESVNEHYSSIYIDSHHEMLRQILNDIPRMNPLIPIFQKKIVQDIFQRVLYVWAVRHPASGYVQGINDLLTPFFTVFLTEYCDLNMEIQNVDIENLPEKNLRQLEADSYWCMTKLLERIQENYVFSQPGIQRKVQSLDDLIKRIDRNLHQHLKVNNVEFIQFAFRWMNNLLMREIPLNCTIRLWDTYHAEPFGFSDFHLYVCAAFLLRFSKNLVEEKDFQGLMLMLQNLPTRNLKANDIALLTAEAYKLQVMFANSPNHTARTN